jgi:hypothetical protein
MAAAALLKPSDHGLKRAARDRAGVLPPRSFRFPSNGLRICYNSTVTEKELRRMLRAIALGVSAPSAALGWAACSPSTETPDAGDATAHSDASEGGIVFPDVTIDSYVDWCDAGPPQWIGMDTCFNYLYVPCGLPTGDYVMDDAGNINRCDQICLGYTAYGCAILTEAGVAQVYQTFYPDGGGPAEDAAQPSTAIYVTCDCYNGGRRPAGLRRTDARGPGALATYFSQMAHLEAASVPAFRRMLGELSALRAPTALLARVARAIREEQRHAKVIGRIARRFGGSVPAPRMPTLRRRKVEAMARENAIEGCVRETYGALVAIWQAEHAADLEIRSTMTRVADDETKHAALSMEAARFYDRKLDARARARVSSAKRRAIRELYEAARHAPHDELVAVAGLPSASQARRLVDALQAQVW